MKGKKLNPPKKRKKNIERENGVRKKLDEIKEGLVPGGSLDATSLQSLIIKLILMSFHDFLPSNTAIFVI